MINTLCPLVSAVVSLAGTLFTTADAEFTEIAQRDEMKLWSLLFSEKAGTARCARQSLEL